VTRQRLPWCGVLSQLRADVYFCGSHLFFDADGNLQWLFCWECAHIHAMYSRSFSPGMPGRCCWGQWVGGRDQPHCHERQVWIATHNTNSMLQ
jgi:hypothetical protein